MKQAQKAQTTALRTLWTFLARWRRCPGIVTRYQAPRPSLRPKARRRRCGAGCRSTALCRWLRASCWGVCPARDRACSPRQRRKPRRLSVACRRSIHATPQPLPSPTRACSRKSDGRALLRAAAAAAGAGRSPYPPGCLGCMGTAETAVRALCMSQPRRNSPGTAAVVSGEPSEPPPAPRVLQATAPPPLTGLHAPASCLQMRFRWRRRTPRPDLLLLLGFLVQPRAPGWRAQIRLARRPEPLAP